MLFCAGVCQSSQESSTDTENEELDRRMEVVSVPPLLHSIAPNEVKYILGGGGDGLHEEAALIESFACAMCSAALVTC